MPLRSATDHDGRIGSHDDAEAPGRPAVPGHQDDARPPTNETIADVPPMTLAMSSSPAAMLSVMSDPLRSPPTHST